MTAESFIKVEKLRVINNQTLSFRLTMSKNNEKYFQTNQFFARYPEDIHNVPPGILYIPVVSGIICVAWTIGAHIYLEELDKSYVDALNKIRLIMKPWYPKLPFKTKFHAYSVSENNT